MSRGRVVLEQICRAFGLRPPSDPVAVAVLGETLTADLPATRPSAFEVALEAWREDRRAFGEDVMRQVSDAILVEFRRLRQ